MAGVVKAQKIAALSRPQVEATKIIIHTSRADPGVWYGIADRPSGGRGRLRV